MAASVRLALAVVWEEERGRPYVRAKIVDLALVFLASRSSLRRSSPIVSMQLVTTYGAELAEKLGLERVDASVLGAVGQSLAALAITIAALLVLYRLVAERPAAARAPARARSSAGSPRTSPSSASRSTSASWSGFEELYGTLGSLFGFLFLVYLVASCVVVGAEVVAAWAPAARPREPEGPPMTSASGSPTRRGASSGRRAIRRPSRARRRSH